MRQNIVFYILSVWERKHRRKCMKLRQTYCVRNRGTSTETVARSRVLQHKNCCHKGCIFFIRFSTILKMTTPYQLVFPPHKALCLVYCHYQLQKITVYAFRVTSNAVTFAPNFEKTCHMFENISGKHSVCITHNSISFQKK